MITSSNLNRFLSFVTAKNRTKFSTKLIYSCWGVRVTAYIFQRDRTAYERDLWLPNSPEFNPINHKIWGFSQQHQVYQSYWRTEAALAARLAFLANMCEALISKKPLSGKLRGPYMWKALISDKGFAKCIWPLSGKFTGIPEDGVKPSTEVGPSLRQFLPRYRMQTRSSDENSVCLSVHVSVCQTHEMWQNGRKICPDFYTIQLA